MKDCWTCKYDEPVGGEHLCGVLMDESRENRDRWLAVDEWINHTSFISRGQDSENLNPLSGMPKRRAGEQRQTKDCPGHEAAERSTLERA